MFASLILARAGHEILMLERDSPDIASDVESAAASALRKGAPQIVQPHIVMAKCRELLAEHMPDVYEALLAAGVVVAGLWTQMQPSLADKSARPEDARLALLMTRRSTVDWVLRRAVAAQPGVTVRANSRVVGLASRAGTPPHVVGIRTDQGTIGADLVLDATGCRSPIDQWLNEIGARPTSVQRAECGIAYFGRHYRFRMGAAAPGLGTTRIVAGLAEFSAGIWGADNGTMQMAVAPLAMDHRFRTVKNPAVFTAVLRTIPTYRAWLDALDPITDVYTMGGLQNTLRRLVVNGAPVATGLLALGDSVCTTNPTLGRGLSFALWEAVALREILKELPGQWTAQSLAMDCFVTENIAPFYDEQAAVDGVRMEALRHTIFGTPAPIARDASLDRVTYAEVRAAAQFDPTAFRALWRIHGMVQKPAEVYADPRVVAGTREALAHNRERHSMAQPTHEELMAALTSTAIDVL
jgi:2-polyprenyl-6-methoxyphenol hydroxylase-like FAD-dependent oxidoreductase